MNGNRNKTKETKEEEQKPISASLQIFPLSIAKIAIAQIFQSIGLTGSQNSALEALSNIATRYLQTLAKSASSNANSCGRTQCNLFDVIHAIEDMNIIQGFNGASNINGSILKSGVLKEIMRFVNVVDEIPFAKPIPRRNFGKRSRLCESKRVQEQSYHHIPSWLPNFPDASTYKNVEIRVRKAEKSGFFEEEKDREVVEKSIEQCCEKSVDWENKKILPVERPKVKFKIGAVSELGLGFNVELSMRNGVCRGGKRISWHDFSGEEDIKSFKRRR